MNGEFKNEKGKQIFSIVFLLNLFLDDGEADEQKGFNDEVKRNYKMNKKDEEAFEAFMNNSGL